MRGARDGAVVRALRLPPMWPGFKFWRRRHMWVELVVGSLPCGERFFSGYSGFPLSSKTNISKFQFDQESGRRRTTLWMCYLQIITVFIYFAVKTIWNTKLNRKPGVSSRKRRHVDHHLIIYKFIKMIYKKWFGK